MSDMEFYSIELTGIEPYQNFVKYSIKHIKKILQRFLKGNNKKFKEIVCIYSIKEGNVEFPVLEISKFFYPYFLYTLEIEFSVPIRKIVYTRYEEYRLVINIDSQVAEGYVVCDEDPDIVFKFKLASKIRKELNDLLDEVQTLLIKSKS